MLFSLRAVGTHTLYGQTLLTGPIFPARGGNSVLQCICAQILRDFPCAQWELLRQQRRLQRQQGFSLRAVGTPGTSLVNPGLPPNFSDRSSVF